jgi:hypothetical protein
MADAEATSRREDIAAAFDKAEAAVPGPTPEPTPEAVATPQAPIGDGKPVGERSRDEKGRYLAQEKEKPASKEGPAKGVQPELPLEAKEPSTEPAPTPAEPKEEIKAPRSLAAPLREAWKKLDPSERAYLLKREGEVTRIMSETASARDLQQKFKEVISPYEPMIRAEGVEPIQAVNNLLRTTAALATGPAQTKAQIVAGIIRTYGVDIPTLDALLAGQAAPVAPQQQAYQPPQPQQFRDPRLDALLEQAQTQLGARAEEQIGEVQGEEFFEDVRDEMADILDLAAKRGVAMTARDAYNRAVAFDPGISRILEQRKAAANSMSTQRVVAGTASVRGQPATPPPAQGADKDWHSAIEAAMNAHSGQK